ncbi:TPA: hypothetical protein ACGW3F_003160 [Bacillus paranthracis]
MSLHQYWDEIFHLKELQRKACEYAQTLLEEFPSETFGTVSYFHALAERYASTASQGADVLIHSLKEETERKRVASYWNVENEHGVSFFKRIEGLLTESFPWDVCDITKTNPEDEKHQKYFAIFMHYFWHFLADEKSKEEKRNGETIQ